MDPATREAARALIGSADVIDLHNDMEVPVRVFGYDPNKEHRSLPFPRPFMGHTDYPRLKRAGFTGIVADIATNVLRGSEGRLEQTRRNIEAIRARSEAPNSDVCVVKTVAEYRRATAEGKLGIWIGLQGGNALEADLGALDGELGDWISRITLVHLTRSSLGGTSSPSQADEGLTELGHEMVERCNARRILVDLSHAGRKTFFDALEAHTKEHPPVVTHTGVSGVRPHWRNIDDEQIRAVAERGGVVGILYHGNYLERVLPGFPGHRRSIVDHLAHVIEVGGEDCAALGSDYDGMITPPWDMPEVTDHDLLVGDMLARGWSERRILKILGANALRLMESVRS